MAFIIATTVRWGWFYIEAYKKGQPPAFTSCDEVLQLLNRTFNFGITERAFDRHDGVPLDYKLPRSSWRTLLQFDYFSETSALDRLVEKRSMPTPKDWHLLYLLTNPDIRSILESDDEAPINLLQMIVDKSERGLLVNPRGVAAYNMRMTFKEWHVLSRRLVAYNMRMTFKERDVLSRRIVRKARNPKELSDYEAQPLHLKAAFESPLLTLLYRITPYFVFLLYVVARLSILAIALSSLRSMPDSAYVSTWAKYLPFVD